MHIKTLVLPLVAAGALGCADTTKYDAPAVETWDERSSHGPALKMEVLLESMQKECLDILDKGRVEIATDEQLVARKISKCQVSSIDSVEANNPPKTAIIVMRVNPDFILRRSEELQKGDEANQYELSVSESVCDKNDDRALCDNQLVEQIDFTLGADVSGRPIIADCNDMYFDFGGGKWRVVTEGNACIKRASYCIGSLTDFVEQFGVQTHFPELMDVR